MPRNWKQAKAIEEKNRQRLLAVCKTLDDEPGIYILLRTDEAGIKYAYIGQAKHMMQRMLSHLEGHTQHIDLSLKKHGFFADDKPHGWKLFTVHHAEAELDDEERKLIATYANAGYQLRNKTAGGQDAGKVQIDEYRPHKGYRDGLAQGYKNASRDIAKLFDKHLDAVCKSDPPSRYQLSALEKLNEFLGLYKKDKNNGEE